MCDFLKLANLSFLSFIAPSEFMLVTDPFCDDIADILSVDLLIFVDATGVCIWLKCEI